MNSNVGTRQRRRGQISRDMIVDAAARIINGQGFDALSMPRLAEEVGCGTMTLYGHIEDKDHVVALVVERVISEVPDPRDEPGNPLAVLVQLRRMRCAIQRHPGLGTVIALGRIKARAIDQIVESGVQALRDCGLSDEEAVRVYFALLIHVLGFITWESPRVLEQPREAYLERWDQRVQALPRSFHALPETVEVLKTVADEAQFEAGFSSLWIGLVASSERLRAALGRVGAEVTGMMIADGGVPAPAGSAGDARNQKKERQRNGT
jgi:AcrR family transcriptional regulator